MSNTREYKSDVFSMLMEYPELTLPDKRKTIFLNIHGNRDGVSEELSTVLDYFETSNPTDEYTRGLEERVKENRNDDEWRENYMTWEMKLDERYRQGMEKGHAEGLATVKSPPIMLSSDKQERIGMSPLIRPSYVAP